MNDVFALLWSIASALVVLGVGWLVASFILRRWLDGREKIVASAVAGGMFSVAAIAPSGGFSSLSAALIAGAGQATAILGAIFFCKTAMHRYSNEDSN
ncbi:MAG: hypothetical protein HKO13_05500 [Sphingomonas sp.]|nr:hypothetical protein [Sphingomonas sp.]RZV53180.1 MAG: hypothetical protein EX258_00840 [Sphingomonadaceae bacterium]